MTESNTPDSEEVEKTNFQKISAFTIVTFILFVAFLAWIATWFKDCRKVYKKELYAPLLRGQKNVCSMDRLVLF